jgi:hypothetical protein
MKPTAKRPHWPKIEECQLKVNNIACIIIKAEIKHFESRLI